MEEKKTTTAITPKKKMSKRAVKRRIRKTSAAVLLISSIVVASIPVPEAAAANAKNITVDEKFVETAGAGSTTEIVNSTSGSYATAISNYNTIPVVNDGDTIYSNSDGSVLFAYESDSASSTAKSAVILYASNKLVSGGTLTIPDTIPAYIRYSTSQGTNVGLAASTENAEPLCYLWVTQHEYDQTIVTDTSGTETSNTYSNYKETRFPAASSSYSPSESLTGTTNTTDDDGNITSTTKVYHHTYFSYQINICDAETESNWNTDTTKFFKLDSGISTTNIDSSKNYLFSGNTKVSDDNTSYENSASDGISAYLNTETAYWLKEAEVHYISNQSVTYDSSSASYTVSDRGTSGIFSGWSFSSLRLSSDLKGIAKYAFYQCNSLTSVTGPSTLEYVGPYAFANCGALTSVDFTGSALPLISEHTFENCYALSSFTMPASVLYVCDRAFYNTTSLRDVDFSKSTANVTFGIEVFRNSALVSVVWPVNSTSLGRATFKGCTSLTDVTYNSSQISDEVPISLFESCSSLDYVEIWSNNLKFIDSDCLNGGTYVYTIEDFKDDVGEEFYFAGKNSSQVHTLCKENQISFKYLDTDYAGYYEIVIIDDNNTPTSTADDTTFTYLVKDNGDGTGELSSLGIEGTAATYDVEIPGTVGPVNLTYIGTDFHYNTKIKSITIPKTITEIAAGAFEGCYNLTKVTFEEPNNIETIGAKAFSTQTGTTDAESQTGTPKLMFIGVISDSSQPYLYATDAANNINNSNQTVNTYIDFYSGVPSGLHVHYNADKGMKELFEIPVMPTTLTITPNSVTYGEAYTAYFDENSVYYSEYLCAIRDSLEQADIMPNGLDYTNATDAETACNYIAAAILAYNNGQTTYTYNGATVALTTTVFDTIESVYVIDIPTGIECFKEGLFSKVSDTENYPTLYQDTQCLTGTPILNVYTDVADSYTNDTITKITMRDIQQLDDYAFYGCDNLETVIWYPSYASGGEKIGSYAFAHCDSLKNVTLPSTLSSIYSTMNDTTGLRPFACDNYLTQIYFASADDEVSTATSGNKFACEAGVFYELDDNGDKTAVVECLETRNYKGANGTNIGSSTVGPDELAGVDTLYEEAFMNVTGVGKVDLSATSVKVIPSLCFAIDGDRGGSHTDGVSNVVLPNSCTTITNYAFLNTPVSNLTIPTTTTIFGAYAFANDSTTVDTWVEVSTSEGSAAEALVDSYEKYHWSLGSSIKSVYTVNFYDQDGTTLISSQTVEEGSDATDPTTMTDITMPTHDGYVFSKWDRNFTNVSKNLDIYAVYVEESAKTYTVVFYDWDFKTIVTRTVEEGGAAEEPKDPKRDGYTFAGWTATGDYSNVTQDIQVIATYTSNSASSTSGSGTTSGSSSTTSGTTSGSSDGMYTLTVVNGTGSGTYAAGASAVIAAYTPSTGYKFYNWTSSSSTTVFASATSAATSVVMPANNIVVTANYVKSSSGSSSGNSVSGNNANPTSSKNSNTGSTSDTGTTVDVDRDGISNKNLASATVSGSTDDFTVKITETAEATLAVAQALAKEYGSLENIRYFAMDISLYDSTGTTKITDTSGLAVTITLPIPDELMQYAGNNKVAAVINTDDLDKLTPKFSTINGVPCVTFTATHFSPYTIYVDITNLSDGTIDDSPKTGDMIHPKYFLSIGLALIGIYLFLKRDRRPATAQS